MLNAGSRLGPYEIIGSLGAGGMGEVYRARDARLQRDVAIKVLPQSVATDADRLARFAREAQVLASLNHPHIAHVYGIEESPSTSSGQAAMRGLVMELVEGPTLAERMSAGVIPFDEALPIARQIVDALDAAHERGIVHRDLKPANIKLTPDGTVKVLDFGLAKMLSPTGAESRDFSPGLASAEAKASALRTLTTPAMTQAGVIMGTAAYMSPEQARGKPVDKRADIWSFGVILYEMLTGQQLFEGETVSDTIAELLKREIDLRALPPDTPASVRALLEKCLQRDPKKRLRDIGDAWVEASDPPAAAPERSARVLSPMVIALVAGIAALAAGAAWVLKPTPAPIPPLVRFTIPLAPHEQLRGNGRPAIAVAPDGSAVAIVAGRGILLRRLSDFAATPVPGTDGASLVTFSADSKSLLFWAAGEVRRLDLNGGTPERLAAVGMPAANGPNGLAWAPDKTIAYPQGSEITLLGSDGIAKALAGIPTQTPVMPHFLPDGRALLYASISPGVSSIVLHPLDGSNPIVLTQGTAPQFVEPNQLLFTRGGTLYRLTLNLAARQAVGEPSMVVNGIMTGGMAAIPQYAISRTGALYFLPGGAEGADGFSLVTVRPNADPVAVDAPQRSYSDLRLSPDGTRLAMHLSDQDNDIWVRDMTRGTLTRLTFAGGEDETPAWSPDGARLAYASERAEDKGRTIRVKRADGTGEETVLWRAPSHAHVTDWSRDNRWLVLETIDAATRSDIALLDLKDPQSPKFFLKTPFQEYSGRISPNGQWIAYGSNESGTGEVYLQSFPDGGNKLQVSLNGGTAPVWSPDGTRLFYRSAQEVMAVSVTFSPKLAVSSPQRLFVDSYGRLQGDTHISYDAASDGTFIFTRPRPVAEGTQVTIHGVLNWFAQPK